MFIRLSCEQRGDPNLSFDRRIESEFVLGPDLRQDLWIESEIEVRVRTVD